LRGCPAPATPNDAPSASTIARGNLLLHAPRVSVEQASHRRNQPRRRPSSPSAPQCGFRDVLSLSHSLTSSRLGYPSLTSYCRISPPQYLEASSRTHPRYMLCHQTREANTRHFLLSVIPPMSLRLFRLQVAAPVPN